MLKNQQQLENTRRKLAELEKLYAECKDDPAEKPAVREQSLRSLKRAINQLTEEIVRYESAIASGKDAT
jgi:hypothetical protein